MPKFNFTKWIGDTFGTPVPFNTQISELTNKNTNQATSITTLQGQVNQLTATLTTTSNTDKKTIAELQAKLAPDPKEVYWDNRIPKINQTYLRYEEGKTFQIDVKNFFQEQDSNLPTIPGTTNDEKALNSLIWVINNITYTSDKTTWGFDEYWAWAFETQTRKLGDCEDGAILLANIMQHNLIPFWRIRLNAGTVNGGGHCYVTYCRETDDQFVVLDWCYWSTTIPIKDRKLHKDEQNYDDPLHNYGIWFSWNKFYCYGSMQTMMNLPDYLPKVN